MVKRRATGRSTRGVAYNALGHVVDDARWRPVADLTDEVVLVPNKVEPLTTGRIPFEHAALMGYLMGDGSTLREVRFAHLPDEAMDEFIRSVEALGCVVKDYPPAGRARDVVVRGTGVNPGPRGEHEVLRLVRSWGFMGVKNSAKEWPDLVWTLDPADLAVIVGRLFSCDGWVSLRRSGQAAVGIGLSNESLIRGLHRLMLRLGVAGSVRRRKTARKDHWEWTCNGADLLRFAEVVEMPGKDEALAAAVAAVKGRTNVRDWRTRNAPEGYRWEKVRSVEALPGEHRTVAIEVDVDHAWADLVVEHNTWTINRSGDATAEIVDRNTWAFTGTEYLTLPDRPSLTGLSWYRDGQPVATPNPLFVGAAGAPLAGLDSTWAGFAAPLSTTRATELAAWDGRVITEPAWLRIDAVLYVNADDPAQASYYAYDNSALNFAA